MCIKAEEACGQRQRERSLRELLSECDVLIFDVQNNVDSSCLIDINLAHLSD